MTPLDDAPASIDRIGIALHAAAPRLSPSAITGWADALRAPMQASGIVTARRIAMFVGQIAEESAGLAMLAEDLEYVTAARICAVWPSQFPTEAEARPYVRNPKALANRVYAGRLGNGDEASGDGWRFRGAGAIQITGRAAYARLGASVHVPLDELAAWLQTPRGAAVSACWYWSLPSHHPALNALADRWDIESVTRAINGGAEGLEKRGELCAQALSALGESAGSPEVTADDLNAAELSGLPQA